MNFSSENTLTTQAFENQVQAITSSATEFALYPGGGIEGFLGPFGLGADVGDEIYFDHGTHNNLKVTLGLAFRF